MASDQILFFAIIYGVGTVVLFFLSHALREAGRNAGAQGERTALILVFGLWSWAIAANIYALFVGQGFVWLVPSLIIPLLLGIGCTFFKSVKHILEHISLSKLVIVQIYRIAGAVFLIAYYVTGTYMSREFTLNAGWGDVLTGILAVPVALAAYYRISFWQTIVVVWCFIGIGDLILAPIYAQIYGGMRTDDFPINAIPIFFGPPLGIFLHILALRIMWLQANSTSRLSAVRAIN